MPFPFGSFLLTTVGIVAVVMGGTVEAAVLISSAFIVDAIDRSRATPPSPPPGNQAERGTRA